jgi:hypothetical protein
MQTPYPTISNKESWESNKKQQNTQLWSYYVNDVSTYHTNQTQIPIERDAPKHMSRRDQSTNQHQSLCDRTFQVFHPQQLAPIPSTPMIPQPSSSSPQTISSSSGKGRGEMMGNYFLQNPFFMNDMQQNPVSETISSMRNTENTFSLKRDQDLQSMFQQQPAQWERNTSRPVDSRSHRREHNEHPMWTRDTYEVLNHQPNQTTYVDRMTSKLTR